MHKNAVMFGDSARCLRVAEGLTRAARGEVFLERSDLDYILRVFTDAVAWQRRRGKDGSTIAAANAYLMLIKCQNHGELSRTEEKARQNIDRVVRIHQTLQDFSLEQHPGADRLTEAAQFCRLLGNYIFQLCTPKMRCTDDDD